MKKYRLIFSVYEKHQAHRLSSIQEVVGLVSDTLQLLRGNENYTRSEVANVPKILNGSQGNVASKSTASIEMLTSLENLQKVAELYRYDALNLLSCITPDVENIHSVVHHKDQLFSV